MIFSKSLLGISPEAFYPIDVSLARRKLLFVIYSDVLLPVDDQRTIAAESVAVGQAPWFNGLFNQAH